MWFPEFLNKSRIKANEIIDDMVEFLVKKYRQSKKMFTPSTSYGQILMVLSNHVQLIYFYIQNSISELNFYQAYKNQSIYGMSDLTGHIRKLATSAKGEIVLTPKPNSSSGIIYIPNYTKITCLNNNLPYIISLNSDYIIVDKSSTKKYHIPIIQGEIETARFTGTGEDLQSFEVDTSKNTVVSEDGIEIFVNGEKAKVYDSIYPIPFKELGAVVRNSITSQLTVLFGYDINARIPPLGSEITIDYLTCAGIEGNINEIELIEFEFKDTGINDRGETIDLNDIFNISIEEPILLGSSPEPVGITRIIAPMFNKSGLIYDSESVRYHFLKMNMFKSVITWYESTNNVVNVLPMVDLKNVMRGDETYFSIDINKFSLTNIETTRILNSIESSGNKSTNLQINVINPTIKRFVIYLNIEVFRSINGVSIPKESLKNKIKSEISSYLISNKRHNKIPTSDIIRILDTMDEIDTATITFIDENGGIDENGNINVENNEIAVIRGGWEDENGVFYFDSFDITKDSNQSINIFMTTINLDRSQI